MVWYAAALTVGTPDETVREMLRSIHENGFNAAANGLYINWRTGTRPHPEHREFDSDLNRSGKIVKEQFRDSRNERGLVYDELTDMYRVSEDRF